MQYMLINLENLQCRFIEVAEEHVAEVLQFVIILVLHQIILFACRDLRLH